MYKRISKNQAQEILNSNSNSILIDIRDADSYNKSHDNRSINLNNENIAKFIADTPKDYPILVLCYHGNSSQSVASFLHEQGFSNTYSIDGGYEEWNE